MNKKMVGLFLMGSACLSYAGDRVLDIAFVDSFQAMRECEEGKKVGKELDAVREKLSKEIQAEAQKLAAEEKEFKAKLPTMKKELAENEERKLAKRRRALEDRVRDGEEELKIIMQNKTETLAAKVEEGIVQVAKQKGVDAVIDKMTGRVLYTKEDNKGDITLDAIAQVNKQSNKKETTIAKKDDTKATTAAA